MSSSSAEKALVLMLASSAGIHGGLVPAHAAEAPVLGAMFALSALLLAAIALRVDKAPGAAALVAAALLFAVLLAAYVRRDSWRWRRSRTPSRSTCSEWQRR